MSSLKKLIKAAQFLGDAFGKNEAPLNWVIFLLTVAETGDKGITAPELAIEVGVSQGIISRTTKLMTSSYNPAAKQIIGLDLLKTEQDFYYRNRQRVYLSEHGKAVVARLKEIMT